MLDWPRHGPVRAPGEGAARALRDPGLGGAAWRRRRPRRARAAEELGGTVVVKAQVLTGGRGKAGGVKLADGPDEAEARAAEILGLDIRGHIVRRLWIETASEIAREYYLSVALDRGAGQALLMFTTRGRRRDRAGRRGEPGRARPGSRRSARRVSSRITSASCSSTVADRGRARADRARSSRRSTAASSSPTRRSARSTR